MKEGLRTHLPVEYITNRSITMQAQDLDMRLFQEIDRIINLIEEFKSSPECCEFLDLKELENMARHLLCNKTFNLRQSQNKLINGLSVGFLLKNL